MTFQDIFSNKKEKPEQKFKVLIDNREKNSLVPSELVNLGAEIEFKQLEIGDYIVKSTIIERKTIQDLKSSIINKRIYSQIQNLKQHERALLLIEGISEENIYSGTIHENALRGFLLSAALEYKIPIIFTQNTEDTARYLYVLGKKEDKSSPISLLTRRRPKSIDEQKHFILESFPGIGPTTAMKLLKEFKSIKSIINAEEKELKKIIGKRTELFKKLVEQG